MHSWLTFRCIRLTDLLFIQYYRTIISFTYRNNSQFHTTHTHTHIQISVFPKRFFRFLKCRSVIQFEWAENAHHETENQYKQATLLLYHPVEKNCWQQESGERRINGNWRHRSARRDFSFLILNFFWTELIGTKHLVHSVQIRESNYKRCFRPIAQLSPEACHNEYLVVSVIYDNCRFFEPDYSIICLYSVKS